MHGFKLEWENVFKCTFITIEQFEIKTEEPANEPIRAKELTKSFSYKIWANHVAGFFFAMIVAINGENRSEFKSSTYAEAAGENVFFFVPVSLLVR